MFNIESKTAGKIALAVIFIAVVTRMFFVHPTFSDENTYFLMGKQVAEGEIPYKDFGLAHPPLQIYMLAFLFSVFGASLIAGKLLTLISTSVSAYLIFLIAKELYREKAALLAVMLFLVSVSFIAFSTLGYGMWESQAFVLLSLYLLLKNRLWSSAISFVIAIFIRYLAIIYLPFLLLLLVISNKKMLPYLLRFAAAMAASILMFYLVFGNDFIIQSLLFQIYSRLAYLPKDAYQYWGIGFFTMFLAMTAAFVAFIKKDKRLLLFSVYPIFADLFILAFFQTVFYHYFIISVAFVAVAAAKACFVSKNRITYLFISVIILLSIFNNLAAIDFYLNSAHSRKLYAVTDFVQKSTSQDDAIFGEHTVTNYASFISGRRIASNYFGFVYELFDAQQQAKVIENLEKENPKFFVDMKDYFVSNPQFKAYLIANYNTAENIGDVQIYERKPDTT